MLQFSPNIAKEIKANKARGFFTVLVKNDVGTIKFASTTHYNNITLSDGIEYVSDDQVISVEAPNLNTTVDREEYKITIAGGDFDLNDDWVGCKFEVRYGCLNSETNLPYTDLVDTLIFYKGKVNGKAGEYDLEELGSAIFTISGASPMMALEMTGGLYLSRDFVRGRTPKDGCADEIQQGSSSLVLKWGRI